MDMQAVKRKLQYIGAAIVIAAALSTSTRAQHGHVQTARQSARKHDRLLGKWVMVADNGVGANGTTADYRSDGTVLFTRNGKKTTVRYKRESGKAWANRRSAQLGIQSGWDQYKLPGVEMIEFADQNGKYADFGSSLLTLDPKRRVLYNMLTQLWCRPGEQARVKRELK